MNAAPFVVGAPPDQKCAFSTSPFGKAESEQRMIAGVVETAGDRFQPVTARRFSAIYRIPFRVGKPLHNADALAQLHVHAYPGRDDSPS